MKVRVLSENTPYPGLGCEHGLSFHIEYNGKKYLLDTGASGLFAENAEKMGVDLADVDAAFLSHAHYDHSGGFAEFFRQNRTAKVYLQRAAKEKLCYKIIGPQRKYIGIPEGLLDDCRDRFVYVDGYREIGEGIHILPHTTEGLAKRAEHAHMYAVSSYGTEPDDFSHEQTVIFCEKDGLVCFNSCSHAGVENIIKEVKEAFPGREILAFFGGFHMKGAEGNDSCSFPQQEVRDVASFLTETCVAQFYSGHCTGTTGFAWLKEVMQDRLTALHPGMEAEI